MIESIQQLDLGQTEQLSEGKETKESTGRFAKDSKEQSKKVFEKLETFGDGDGDDNLI